MRDCGDGDEKKWEIQKGHLIEKRGWKKGRKGVLGGKGMKPNKDKDMDASEGKVQWG